jgi:hypothetical protein
MCLNNVGDHEEKSDKLLYKQNNNGFRHAIRTRSTVYVREQFWCKKLLLKVKPNKYRAENGKILYFPKLLVV